MLVDPAANSTLTPEEAICLERVCEAFEAAWKRGERPSIEQFLKEAPESVRPRLFNELLELDLYYLGRGGDAASLEEYRRRFPDHFGRMELAVQTQRIRGNRGDLTIPPTTAPEVTALPSGELPPSAANWPRIAGYEIVEELGRGGMGVVYKAKQLAAKRLVALKIIRDGVLAGPEQRARFRIEAEAAARFQHANLVHIYDVGEYAGLPFFSMEFAERGSLEQELSGQPLPPEQASELIETLARAVHYAHEKQIVHRDLKPANVVLAADGRPLITDFGLAKRLDDDTTLTASEAVLGTASYMAPEQAAGQARYVGPAADVYALGAIFYELLTGRPPFKGATRQETMLQVLADEPLPPTRLRPDVPAELETICLKCLEKEPEERYASARDLAEDLSRYKAGQSISAAPLSELDRQARWARQAGFILEEVMTYGVHDAVYKARELHLNRVVALKIIAEPSQADPTVLARLRREAETVARLDHPNIVRIYTSSVLRGRTYVVFEFIAGGSVIEHYVDRPVPPHEAARLIQRLAQAMHYAHQRGVLHCALKPSNILLTADGEPKITNFALSVLLEGPPSERSLSFRLPSYMAPELMDGRTADIGPATDVYALGAILYKLLTGGPPFPADNLADLPELVRSREPPAPSTLQADVPLALDVVCRICLAKASKERFASAGDLAEALAKFAVGAPVDMPEQDQSVSAGSPGPSLGWELVQKRALLAGYEMRRELGRGSMSIVYEARQLASNRLVAVKMMSQDFPYDDRLRAMLREPVENVSRLRHPNIVELLECGEQGGRPYFVMELLPGSLDRRSQGQMPAAAAATLVRTLASTMYNVHQQGIIHGNLKPSYVMLAADGTPKIRGFIASREKRALDDPEREVTHAGPAVMGTPRYMAPEQLSGGAIGPATDVHALGLILYELLTGWRPYRAATLWEMMAQVLHERPQPPHEIRADLPPDLETICLRCLAKKPDQRYPSAGALADDLDRFLTGKPLSVTSNMWTRVTSWFKRKPGKP